MENPGDSPLFIYYLEGRVAPGWEAALPESLLGHWPEEDTSFLFFSQPEDEAVGSLISAHPELRLADVFTMGYDEWQGGALTPFCESGLFFAPPWSREETPPGCRKILLDPGVVFGNGLHPTTRDCLRAMGEIAAGEGMPENVLDLGCGTGILALAAHGLGAKKVLAVDLNPLAAKTARENVAKNKAQHAVSVREQSAEELVDKPAGLLIANIHFAVMTKLVDAPGFCRRPHLVLSGLLRSEAPQIMSQLRARGAEIIREYEHDATWFTLRVRGTS